MPIFIKFHVKISHQLRICGINNLVLPYGPSYGHPTLHIQLVLDALARLHQVVRHYEQAYGDDEGIHKRMQNKALEDGADDDAAEAGEEVLHSNLALLLEDAHGLVRAFQAVFAAQELAGAEDGAGGGVEDGAEFEADGAGCH